jgi:hypothetical protein
MPAGKGTKILGTLRGGTHPKGTAPVARLIGTYGPRTTDPDMVNKPTMTNKGDDENDTYDRARTREDQAEVERYIKELDKRKKKMAAGGAVAAVHKHERAMHKGKPLTKLAKGGSASSRADGCAVKGKTKGRFV